MRSGSAPAWAMAPWRADSDTQITRSARRMPAGIARWNHARFERSWTSGMVRMVASWNVTVAGTRSRGGSV